VPEQIAKKHGVLPIKRMGNTLTLAMAAILMALLIMVVFAPWFTAHDPYQGSVLRRLGFKPKMLER